MRSCWDVCVVGTATILGLVSATPAVGAGAID